jgi:GNAT superfamily N-acetyltransferase
MSKEAANNANLTVRAAEPNDVPVIHSLIRGLAEYEKLAHTFVVTEAQLREHLFGLKPAAEVIIATLGREPVGYALFFSTFSTFVGRPGIWLEDLFVIPTFRQRGIGSRLLAEVAKIAVERRCGRLEWSVLDWNEPAINLYRQRGATILDEWRICRVDGEGLTKLATTGAKHA